MKFFFPPLFSVGRSTACALLACAVCLGLAPIARAFEPSGFSHRMEITVAYTPGSALTDFPVLVRLSSNITGFDYADFRQANGADLRFTDLDGNFLSHEIDTWDETGTSLVWVKLPSLANGAKFLCFYGNPDTLPAVTASDTWSSYAGVWHLNSNLADSSAGNNTMTAYGDSVVTDGLLGSGFVITPSGQTAAQTDGLVALGTADMTFNGTFTVSGWAYHWSDAFSWDHLFYRKNGASAGSGGFSSEFNNTTATTLNIYGNSSTKVAATLPSCKEAWVHVALAFNDTVCTAYGNGESKKTGNVKKATDYSYPLSFGNNYNSSTGAPSDYSLKGKMDELRIRAVASSADWMAAEYNSMTDAFFLSYGPSEITDETAPAFTDAPTLVANANGTFTFTGVLSDGSDVDLYAIYTDTLTGAATTNSLAADVDASSVAVSVTETVTLASGSAYTYAIYGINGLGSESLKMGAGPVFVGEVTIAATSDAEEEDLTPGVFTVTRPSTAASLSTALTVSYSVSGTAVADETYEALSGAVTIPAGESTATIEVKPIYSSTVEEDVTVVVALDAVSCFVGNPDTATLTIVNSEGNVYVRYVSTDGDDANDGIVPANAKASISAAVAALETIVSAEHPGTVYVAAGSYTDPGSVSDSAIAITAPIRVVGMTGNPNDVIVTRSASKTRVFQLDHASAGIQCLTIVAGTALEGIGVKITSNGGEMLDCVVSNCVNTTWNSKGALWMDGGHAARCLFTKNQGSQNGSVLHATRGLIEDCLFTANTCGGAYAVYLENTAVLLNCTIVKNTGGSNSGINANGATCRAVNCAIFENTAPDSTHGAVWGGTAASFVHCASDIAIEGGTDCIVGDPCFKDAAHGDYTFYTASCLFDAGTDTASYLPLSSTDLAGGARTAGAAVDIGCYENQLNEPEVSFAFTTDHYYTDATVTFTPAIAGFPEGTPSFAWDFGDGTTATGSSVEPVTHVYSAAGDCTVSLTVTVGETSRTYTYPAVLHFAPPVLYVNGGNANAAVPYDTEATGAASVADAVAYAVDGCTIRILPGEIVQSKQTLVEKGVRILGSTGNPSDVVLSNALNKINSDGCRIFLLNHADAMVANVTMTQGSANANYAYGADVYIKANGGTVSNCVIRSGRSQHFASYGAGVYMDNGLLTHTEITGEFITQPNYNTNPDDKGVVVHLAGSGARMENCLVHDVTPAKNDQPNIQSCGPIVAVVSGTIANCTIAPNCTAAESTSTDGNFLKYTGGAALYLGNSGHAYNCVASGLTNVITGTPTPFAGTAKNFVNCAGDSGEVWGGTDCIDGTAAAFYANAANQDYHPALNGPLIGAGLTSSAAGTTDLDGHPRLMGREVDIGCYEGGSISTMIFLR